MKKSIYVWLSLIVLLLTGCSSKYVSNQVLESGEPLLATNVGEEVNLSSFVSLGMTAYYPFNGNALDACGFNNHGTVYGATRTSDRFGNPNRAYQFDGIDDYIEVADKPWIDITGNYTISHWVYVTTFNESIILSKHYCYNDYDGSWISALRADGRTQQQASPLFIGEIGFTTAKITPNKWYHVAYTFNDTTNEWKAYHNGVLVTSATLDYDIRDTAWPLLIGKQGYSQPTAMFKGKIDDVAIFNRALSAVEINQLYKAPAYNMKLVHANGIDILDKNEALLRLRGVSMTNGVYDELDINKIIGTPLEPSLNDYLNVKAMGANTVRLYLQYEWLFNPDRTISPAFFTFLDRQISYAKKTGVFLILNLHYFGKGGQGGGFFPVNGTYGPEHVYTFWNEIAKRYANEYTLAGYDLINEPQESATFTESNLYSIYNTLIANLRSMGDNHLVFIADPAKKHDNIEAGFSSWYINNSAFQLVTDLQRNVAYTYHWYKPSEFTLQTEPYSGYFEFGADYPYIAYKNVSYLGGIYYAGISTTNGWVQLNTSPDGWKDLSAWNGKYFSISLIAGDIDGKVWFDEVKLERKHKVSGAVQVLTVKNSNLAIPRSFYKTDKPACWYEDSNANGVRFALDPGQTHTADGSGSLLVDNYSGASGWYGGWKNGKGGGLHSTFYPISSDYYYRVTCWVKTQAVTKKNIIASFETYDIGSSSTYNDSYSLNRIKNYYVSWALAKSVPLYCGEWGSADPRQSLNNYPYAPSMQIKWLANQSAILNNTSGNMGMKQSFTFHDYKDYLKENRFYLGYGLFDPNAKTDIRDTVKKAFL